MTVKPESSINPSPEKSAHIPVYKNPGLSIEERVADLLDRMCLQEKVAQLYCGGRVVEMDDENAIVSVEVTNSGDRNGDELVQLYIHDRISKVTRPVKELKGFQRISLDPGETKIIEFVLTPVKLASLDLDMKWRIEPGLFDVMDGPDSVHLQKVTLELVK